MAKTAKTKGTKPEELINVEKFYGFKFLFETSANSVSPVTLQERHFTLNSSGRVSGLSFPYSAGITNISPLRNLSSLQLLNITSNKVEDISILSSLKLLKTLFIGGNKVKNLEPLIECEKLKELIIWNNPIEEFSVLEKLVNLQTLYCQSIGLKDLGFVKNLDKLNYLDAAENLIEDISVLEDLLRPIPMDLSGNIIKVISKKIAERYEWFKPREQPIRRLRNDSIEELHLEISENPLEFPPHAVIDLGEETIRNFYDTAEEFGSAPLSEGRIIVVGDGSAGKSSLIERLLYNTFEKGKSQTNGIRIENWDLPHPTGRPLLFHLWDFGGQEIQHAVHKFFFTEGCLYILVLDNRKEEEPEYWLQQIESLGGSAPVFVVFNKHDENSVEIADRKFLKEKYPNIVSFFNVSCKTGYGFDEFKNSLEGEVIQLRTVDEQFPNNWFEIKRAIEKCTSSQHYIDYKNYSDICRNNNALREKTQKLLLKYFTTIGAITWFGDTFLNFLHVLSPAWITQGVYKIITSKTTDKKSGIISINDFAQLLTPNDPNDYTYSREHYGYILSMMKKFDLCYTPDDITLLIPSAFVKVPKVEYSEFRGESVRTYILQFKEYMPLALIHRFTAKQLPNAYDDNYWYSGIVIKDSKSNSLSMVQADKGSKRIYVRIKGEAQLGMWEHIRRELDEITKSYAKIPFEELIALDERSESTVAYSDLVSHIKANKSVYFHPKLQRDFNVGYLMGLFEKKESTLEKFKKGEIFMEDEHFARRERNENSISLAVQILNNNSPQVITEIKNEINVDIDIQIVNKVSSDVKGDANYLLGELGKSNKALRDALEKVIEFADDAKTARNSGQVKEKGWGRKLKSVIQTISSAGEQLKNIQDGGETVKSMFHGLKDLASHFNFHDVINTLHSHL